jgi:hypothetical protein
MLPATCCPRTIPVTSGDEEVVMRTMKAAVLYEPGDAEMLKIEERPIPTPRHGEVLIQVKAFGLNRSER